MKTNKKGVIDMMLVLGIVIIILLSAVFVLARGNAGGGGTLESLTPKSADCKNPAQIPISIQGDLSIGDAGILFATKPTIENFKIKSIEAGNSRLLGFGVGQEEFQYEVFAVNTKTGGKIGRSFEATGVIDNDETGTKFPYLLQFDIPDNDCNRIVDDFQIEVRADISGDTVTGVTSAKGFFQVRNGGLLQ